MPCWKDRRRAQAGTTLVELLVSVVIMGFALVLIVGTFSTGLLDAGLAERNTAVEAITSYELETIQAASFNPSLRPYSDCFATENPAAPSPAPAYTGACSSGYTLRADVSAAAGPTGTQTWTVSVTSNGSQIGNAVSTIKTNR